MPIISKIGRNSVKTRGLFFGMYAFLILGAGTMVYPFMLMISGSTKSAVDIKYFDAVPRFLHDDLWLYRKHIEALFNEQMIMKNITYDDDTLSFEMVTPPATINKPLLAEWMAFLAQTPMPAYSYQLGHLEARLSRTTPLHLRGIKRALKETFDDDIRDVNEGLKTNFTSWNEITVRCGKYLQRREKLGTTPFDQFVADYKTTAPAGMKYFISPEGFYKKMFLKSQYSKDIQTYNTAHGTHYGSYADVRLPRTFPASGTTLEKRDWELFVRETLATHWLRVTPGATPMYQAFLRAKHGAIDSLNRNYDTAYKAFADIPMLSTPPATGMAASDWEAFLAGWRDPDSGLTYKLPIDHLRVTGPEFAFRDFLKAKYGDLAGINAALGSAYTSLQQIQTPQRDMHDQWFLNHKGFLKWEFVTRNYKTVADYLLLHGRGVINTVIYCSLAVLLALLVNPLAAYAMSRYRMPSSYKILLFLMCTMAFPPMVTQIPNFLMLRRLGLLNTFAALILPGLANGYAIFLLKGFFDSQPRELYESAQLDGASEWTIFWQITMSLSKPILAVIALQAFTLAYSNFMFAFVVCQDEKMWTIMVWLYQLQQRSGQAVMYASLIIAAIPTFLIFLFCQNIIMRGIVVPAEK